MNVLSPKDFLYQMDSTKYYSLDADTRYFFVTEAMRLYALNQVEYLMATYQLIGDEDKDDFLVVCFPHLLK
jgi:hypothetical protein